jgi:hypothetical protein
VAYGRKFRALARDYGAGRISRQQLEASVRGWVNHVRHGDTEGLRRDLLGSVRIDPRPLGAKKKGSADGDHAALYQNV